MNVFYLSMFPKIKLLLLFLFNNVIVNCLSCENYKFNYYYPTNITKLDIKYFNKSTNIIIDEKKFYINNKEYESLKYMGTGIFNGTYLNIINNTFFTNKLNYSVGSNDNKLYSWVSISDKNHKHGSKIYIKEFNNLEIKINNKTITHNGCFRVDDGYENSCTIRIFTENKTDNLNINNHVNLENKECELLDYSI